MWFGACSESKLDVSSRLVQISESMWFGEVYIMHDSPCDLVQIVELSMMVHLVWCLIVQLNIMVS